MKADIQPAADQHQKIRVDDSSSAFSGLLTPEGSWHLHLFKRRFQAVVFRIHGEPTQGFAPDGDAAARRE
jgi:hypothetical protein